MANSDDIYEKWRTAAARQAADDRFSVLWDEMVAAYPASAVGMGPYNFYMGLRRAYSLLTGDPEEAVQEQVARAARVPVPL